MSEPLRVGVVGCGVIAARYVQDSGVFEHWRPVACADLDARVAHAFADEHALRALALDDLVADAGVDLILNLTPPKAHAAVTAAALAAGKHVYTEKPLAVTAAEARPLVEEAVRRGLRLGCAPDTFLSSPYETGRRLIADGAIGAPVGAAASMLVGGPDAWHPNAAMFYRAGGGPLLDIAPYYLTVLVSLLGPIQSAAAFAETPSPERTLGAGARAGDTIQVEVPTHAAAVLRLHNGSLATLTVSFETRGQYLSGLTVYGTGGVLTLPDANAFSGDVVLSTLDGESRTVEFETRGARETRGIGIDDLALAIVDERPHRANAELALHVLEAAEAVVDSASDRRFVVLSPPRFWNG
ncbi:MAG TPA: Gfo/Idh/MocA family oxidoreductase [Gaiellaceae bacterium]